MRGSFIVLSLTATLAGCTTSLSTRPSYDTSSSDTALGQYEYRLPMLQYAITAGYKVSSCPGGTDTLGNPTKLNVKVETVAASDYVTGEAYSIDYRGLSNIFKITDFSIEEWEGTGTIKGINASAEDRTGDIVKSAVELGIAGASLGMGNPAGMIGVAMADDGGVSKAAGEILAASELSTAACAPQVVQALAEAERARSMLKQLASEVDAATARIDAITVRANLKLSAPSDRRTLLRIHQKQLGRLAAISVERAALDRADQSLVFAQDLVWPTNPFTVSGSLGTSGELQTWIGKAFKIAPSGYYDPEKARSLVRSSPIAETIRPDVIKMVEATLQRRAAPAGFQSCGVNDVVRCLVPHLGIWAALTTERAAAVPCVAGKVRDRACIVTGGTVAARADHPHQGIFVRQPVRARLLLCDEDRSCEDGTRRPLLRTGWDMAPQLGQLRFVSLTNGPFQNNALSIAVRQDGTIAKFQYAEKASILAGALAAASSAATKVQAETDKREKERKQAIADRRAEITYQRQEVTYQRGEAAYQQQQITAARTEAAAIRADEIAKVQYEIDMVTKQKALLLLRFPPLPADPVVPVEFENETTRLNSIAAQLQAKLAVLQAQAALGGG